MGHENAWFVEKLGSGVKGIEKTPVPKRIRCVKRLRLQALQRGFHLDGQPTSLIGKYFQIFDGSRAADVEAGAADYIRDR